jgi:Family of unknown function (DUF5677)
MPDEKVVFYRDFLSKAASTASKFQFDSNDDAVLHIFTLLSSSIELLDNIYVLALNESKIGIPILLRSILEASVDIQFILIEKSNYRRIEVEDLLLWKGIIDSAYKGNEFIKHIRKDERFEKEAKENAEKLREFKRLQITKADIATKFKSTIFADAYDSIYATLCSHSHNGKSAQQERHITIQNGKSKIEVFKENSLENYEYYLWLAARFLLESTISFNEACHYGLDGEINELGEILNNADFSR